MSSFQVVQTVNMSREFIIKTLVEMDRQTGRTNTPEKPSELSGYWNVEIDWDDFWRCLSEVCEATTINVSEKYGIYSVSPYDIIKKAVDIYHKTEWFQKAVNDIREAEKAKKEAERLEELRVRQDVPEITKMYDTLKAEKETIEKKLLSYQRFVNTIQTDITDMETTVYEAKWAPKYFKDTAKTIKQHATAEWNGNNLVSQNRYY